MEFSIATLLSNFTDDKLVAVKVLEKKLGCQDENSLRKLQIVLDVLQKIGLLVKDRGKYRRVTEEGVIEAKLRCSSKGFCFAIQDMEGSEDIYIRESHLSTAWNGDRVLVKLTKEGSRRRSPEGEVRLVLERSNQSLLARVKHLNTGFRAVPLDDRLLFELELEPDETDLMQAIDHLVHVEVQRYPLGQHPPIGRVVQILGSDAEAAADIDLVCCKHDLPRTFSPNVLAATAGLPTPLKETVIKQRLDLRQLLTVAVTSEGSISARLNKNNNSENGNKEAALERLSVSENAFTLEKTDPGHWRLGIHTTDVAHYVLPESPLDRESQKRGSCVYLGETVLPMLPQALEESCSLVPGSERLALSVLITLNTVGQIVEFEIQSSVIKVDYLLNSQALSVTPKTESEDGASYAASPVGTIDTSTNLNHSAPNLISALQDLNPETAELLNQLAVLGQVVREQRRQRGGFELQLPSSYSPYNDEGELGAMVGASASLPSLLTELVILANHVVAAHLQALEIPVIYRVQPAPDPEEVQEVIKLASNLGIELTLEQEAVVQPSDFKRFTQQFAQSPESEQVLTYLLRDTLKPASYSTIPAAHFGLAIEQGYTRCNSPLQRYPDLLVQRALQTLFEQGRDRRTTRAKERVNLHHSSSHGQVTWNVLPPELQQELETDMSATIVHLNEREKEVQDAQADLAGLQKAQLMKERIGEVFSGLITGVQSYGFFVEIEVVSPNGRLLRVEGLVHVSSLKDDWYEYRNRQQALFGRKNRASYRLGDRVPVQVKSVDYYRQQIDLVTVNGNRQPNNEELFDQENGDELIPDSEFYPDEE
ncbi:MAG: VacB/RNase II family 3'-5' exoribonuclease [Chroococcidiopsidaceae cyanobacterium CP_BM_ER_R8_30]|nr:VacB/RNase II family 3'-5' exoribonuclease [Chroococcidiopsidaceae cyanobacterium CP_BM_ER_R8_30]